PRGYRLPRAVALVRRSKGGRRAGSRPRPKPVEQRERTPAPSTAFSGGALRVYPEESNVCKTSCRHSAGMCRLCGGLLPGAGAVAFARQRPQAADVLTSDEDPEADHLVDAPERYRPANANCAPAVRRWRLG